ncbi:MAG: hypothetical protein D6732_28815 [Methanobacteriota archaeon]|nr:MAG: hypothetical protein D6732_28815 [Euryarchaeota archaeon]
MTTLFTTLWLILLFFSLQAGFAQTLLESKLTAGDGDFGDIDNSTGSGAAYLYVNHPMGIGAASCQRRLSLPPARGKQLCADPENDVDEIMA